MNPPDKFPAGANERTRLDPIEPLVERMVEKTREFLDAKSAPDLTNAVMRQVAQLEPRPVTRPHSLAVRLAGSLWSARRVSFEWRPAYGLLTSAALVALAVFSLYEWRSVENPSMAPAVAPKLFVQFRLQATDASNVRLAGSFTNWQPRYELHQIVPGVWTITLPLPAGVHDYSFVIDDQRWVPDPYAPAVNDGFGGTNSRLALLSPEDSRL
jgi:hypothetical protein